MSIEWMNGASVQALVRKCKDYFYQKSETYSKTEIDGMIASSTKPGIMKLYTEIAQHTDGTVTAKAIYDVIKAIEETHTSIQKTVQLGLARGWHEPGEIFQWSSKKKRPERTLVCNGAGLSKTDPLFADLYAAIGTDFGESDDGTMFLLPDYIKCYNADGTVNPNVKGLFPRPTDNVDEIGVKEQDTIRNITGILESKCWGSSESLTAAIGYPSGAFKSKQDYLYGSFARQATDYYGSGRVEFSASNVVPTSFENKPYSIRGLYLIAY